MKRRKILWGLSLLGAAVAPIATVVSCGGSRSKVVATNTSDKGVTDLKWDVAFARKQASDPKWSRLQGLQDTGVVLSYKDAQNRVFMFTDGSQMSVIHEDGTMDNKPGKLIPGNHGFSYAGDYNDDNVFAISNDGQVIVINKDTTNVSKTIPTTKLQEYISQLVSTQTAGMQGGPLQVDWTDTMNGQKLDYISHVQRYGDKMMIIGKTKGIQSSTTHTNTGLVFTFGVFMDATGAITPVPGFKQGYNGDDITQIIQVDDEYRAFMNLTLQDSSQRPYLHPIVSKIDFAADGAMTLALHDKTKALAAMRMPEAQYESMKQQLQANPQDAGLAQTLQQIEGNIFGMTISGANPEVWGNYAIPLDDQFKGSSLQGKIEDLQIQLAINDATSAGFATGASLAYGRIVYAKADADGNIIVVNSNGIIFKLSGINGQIMKAASLVSGSEWASIARNMSRWGGTLNVGRIASILWNDKDGRNNIVDHIDYDETTKKMTFARMMEEDYVARDNAWHHEAVVTRDISPFFTQNDFTIFANAPEFEDTWTQGDNETIGEIRMIQHLSDVYVVAGEKGGLAILNSRHLIQPLGDKIYTSEGKVGVTNSGHELVYDDGDRTIPKDLHLPVIK